MTLTLQHVRFDSKVAVVTGTLGEIHKVISKTMLMIDVDSGRVLQ